MNKLLIVFLVVCLVSHAKEIPNFPDLEKTVGYFETWFNMSVMRLNSTLSQRMGSEPGFAATLDDLKTYLLQFISYYRNALGGLKQEMNDEFNDVEYYRSSKNLDNAVAAKRQRFSWIQPSEYPLVTKGVKNTILKHSSEVV